ncbi:MAG TPA: hypothetical protein PKL83_00350 [bacterium]|nr:hypothetical protein [bacterium]
MSLNAPHESDGSQPHAHTQSAVSRIPWAAAAQWLSTAIVWIAALLVFFVPFVFADWTVEYVRYNKVTVVLFGALLIALLWAVKIIITGEVRLKKTVMDLPVLLFGAAAVIAYVMSKIQDQSLWGTFPNFEDSLILTGSLLVVFYALINHMRSGRDWLLILGMVLASAAFLGIVTLLQYYEVYTLPFGSLSQNQLFTPFGTLPQLALFLAVLLPLAGGFLIGSISTKRWMLTALISVLYLTSVMVIGIVDYWPAWILGAIGVLIAVAVSYPVLKGGSKNLVLVPLAVFVLSVLVFKIPAIRNGAGIFETNVAKPITLSFGSSFTIAKESISKYMIAGVGQGNYGYAYKALRPYDFNQKTDWLLNYNRPYDQFFLVATTMGLAGLAALVFLSFKIITSVIKALASYTAREDSDPAVLGLFVSLLSYIGLLILTYETIPLQLLFWVLLALAVYIGFEPDVSGVTGEKVFAVQLASGQGKQRDFLSWGIGAAAIVLAVFIGYKAAATYAVDVNLRKAINAGNEGDVAASLQHLNDVLASEEIKDYDLRGVSIILHNQGVAAEVNQESEEQLQQDIERKRLFFAEAVRYARLAATEGPLVSENWEVLLGIYGTLADYGINKIDQEPLDDLMKQVSVQLSTLTPSEVTWRLRMANYYIKGDDNTPAYTLLSEARYLKPNLTDVAYLAAKALGEDKLYDDAIAEANTALRALDADHTWAVELNALVDEWEAAKAKAAKDTAANSAAETPAEPATETPATETDTEAPAR